MKRSNSRDSHRSEKPGSSRQEDGKSVSRPKTEEEKLRRRREWMIQQQREREHEKLKKKMILEYEIRRAKEKGLPLPKGRSPSRGSSKTRSRSEDSRHGRNSPSRSPRPLVMSEKVESSNGTKQQLFKGPEGTQISTAELRRIKVDIHRNIPAKTTVKNELERDIVNPEDVVLKRREGEGSKPIFAREEITKAVSKTEEIEEHRIIMTVDRDTSAESPQKSKQRSASLSPRRKRSHEPQRTSRHARRDDVKHQNEATEYRDSYKTDRYSDSKGASREHRERHRELDRRRASSHTTEEDRSRYRRDHRGHSRSREREDRGRERESYRRSDREDKSYRERSRERSRDRRDERGRSRERRQPVPPHYVEPVPVPVYYGNFPPRPIVVGPLVPFRGQMPICRMRLPTGMPPMRPYPPRFHPPDMYRLGLPHPRFGRLF